MGGGNLQSGLNQQTLRVSHRPLVAKRRSSSLYHKSFVRRTSFKILPEVFVEVFEELQSFFFYDPFNRRLFLLLGCSGSSFLFLVMIRTSSASRRRLLSSISLSTSCLCSSCFMRLFRSFICSIRSSSANLAIMVSLKAWSSAF
ncbi:hypothetical protein CCH79_00007043 [Gambusia affinis]|uniref:Uncharacterized protein n=1 Tax=Gambusia affinis TaxID=33528 RepID=A0A315VA19_GAMAF|nr:hypothetical protein CCH79_00007043 [Gambusia affinis]